MKTLIDYDPVDSDFNAYVMVDKISHLRKAPDGENTEIHLINGGVLITRDSLKTISARINLASD